MNVTIYPKSKSVGDGLLNGWSVPEQIATKFIESGMFSTAPIPTSERDISVLLNLAKKELSAEQQAIADEREKLQREIEAFNKMKGVSESEDNLLLDKKAKKVTV